MQTLFVWRSFNKKQSFTVSFENIAIGVEVLSICIPKELFVLILYMYKNISILFWVSVANIRFKNHFMHLCQFYRDSFIIITILAVDSTL